MPGKILGIMYAVMCIFACIGGGNMFQGNMTYNIAMKAFDADTNNATDADLLAAWALVRASDRWDEEAYGDHAIRILDDAARLLD